MNPSTWRALVLAAGLGACKGPEPAMGDPPSGVATGETTALRETPVDPGAGEREASLVQGPTAYGDVCDVQVRQVDEHPGLFSGWPRGGADFVIQPKQDADWVDPANGSHIKFLASSQKHLVSIDSNSGTVTIGGTPFQVVRHSLPFFGYAQGVAVDMAGAASKDVILWLMVDQYAYEVVLRDR